MSLHFCRIPSSSQNFGEPESEIWRERRNKRTAKEETHVRTKAAIFTIDANICCSTQPGCTSAAPATAEVPPLSSCSCSVPIHQTIGVIGMCRPSWDFEQPSANSIVQNIKSIIFFATHFPSYKTNTRCSIHVLCVCHLPCCVYVHIAILLSCLSLSSLSSVPP